MTDDKAMRKLKKVKIALMRNPKYALWQGVMMMGKTEIQDGVPTAYTNGRDEVYGREFVLGLSEKQLAFVILHEVLHKAFRHLTTWSKLVKIDMRLTNMACDYVINNLLVKSDPSGSVIELPRGNFGVVAVLYDPKFDGMNTKQVFDILKKEEEEGGGRGGDSHDEHGWSDAASMSDEEKKKLEKEIDRALRQGQIAHQKLNGKGAGDMDRALGELLEPAVDWREVLREYVTSACSNKDTSSWRRVNRRFIGHDVFMPTLYGEAIGRIAIGIDTSGSIEGSILTQFLSEVQSIATDVSPESIDLLYWDSGVSGHEVYSRSDMEGLARSTKPRGGGGTEPACVPKYLKDNSITPECVVMLTDGHVYGDWGTWDVPVLWVVVGSGNVAPVGRTVNVKEMS